MKNITYTERNGIYYPDLELPQQTNYPWAAEMNSIKASAEEIILREVVYQ